MGSFIRELGILVSCMSFMHFFKQKITTKLDKKNYGLSEKSQQIGYSFNPKEFSVRKILSLKITVD
jgi:hypothetical protein